MDKVRLDVLLHSRGEFPSREAARRAVMAGLVEVGGTRVDKPGTQVDPTSVVRVKTPEHSFVSRGGLKLERALSSFAVNVQGTTCIDVGASTGGFTDCLLQHKASLVYAVDVGYGQLAWSLRQDERVRVMERMNFRHADVAIFDPKPTVAVMDVSFISTKLLLEKLGEVCEPSSDVISLVKPQFEAGRGRVGKGGIVRNPQVHFDVLMDMMDHVTSIGWSCKGLDYSPISGGDGNIEFLAWWKMRSSPSDVEETRRWQQSCADLVKSAWSALNDTSVDLGTT